MTHAHGSPRPDAALADLRVLDLAGPIGAYCTKLLADLGADVIKVEPPGGDRTRRFRPFYQDDPAPNHSLYFWYFNTNKLAHAPTGRHAGLKMEGQRGTVEVG